MAGRFSVEAVFKAVDKITAPVSKMQNRLGKFTRGAEKGLRRVNRMAGKMASGFKRGAKVIAVSAGIAGAAIAQMAQAGIGFEQAITNVGAVGLKTRDEIKTLEVQALELGRSTKFTATESANAMETLAKAGFNTQEILKATPAVLSAAAASGLEIAEVADHMSNVLKGLELGMDQSARVANVLALASARTNSSIGSLGESMKNVAATASDLNLPLEEVVASVALLQDVGLDASVAGSAFNTMLTKMAAPSAGMVKKMKKLGISFKDANGDMLPFNQVLEQLNTASKKVGGNFDKVAFLSELVGLRGQKAASKLSKLFETGKLEKLTKELKEAEGVAEKMAVLRMSTVQGSMTLLGSAVDAVKVKIFNLNSGPLKDTIDKMTAWVSANEDLIADNVQRVIDLLITNLPKIAMWAERIAIGIAVFAGLSLILKTFITIMTAVNLVMAMNPIGLIVIAVAALAAGLVFLYKNMDSLLERFDKMPVVIRIMLHPFKMLLKTIKLVGDTVGWVWDKLGFGGDSKKIELKPPEISRGMSNSFDALGLSDGEGGLPLSPQVVSPQERVARNIEEKRSTSSTEVTIKDESGRAEITKQRGFGGQIQLQQTGAFG